MASWWHNSLGYMSIDVQQLLLGVLAASTLIPERSCLLVGNQPRENKLMYYHLKTRHCVQVKPLLIYCYSMYYNSS